MTPLQLYKQDLADKKILADSNQAELIEILEQIFITIVNSPNKKNNILKRIFGKSAATNETKGLYVWGGVGVGKTYLMDTFHSCLPLSHKRRLHFHQFMAEVHKSLNEFQGKKEPLSLVAEQVSKQCKVLCLDEFIVEDITDAMILAGLLKELIKHGIYLIVTSNTQPDDLYRNGLQRQRFLPAIKLINENLQIFNLDSTKDYRLQNLREKGCYFTPLNQRSSNDLENYFSHFTIHEGVHYKPLEVVSRKIPVVKSSHNAVWFNFDVICNQPRSQLDYIEIAKSYSVVIVSEIPLLSSSLDDQVAYLIKLVDVFYDYKVKLIISAEVAIDKLYIRGAKLSSFERTKSRLIEMQTKEYWQQPHKV